MKQGSHSKIVIVTFLVTVLLWLLSQRDGHQLLHRGLHPPFCVFAMTGVIKRQDLEEINWSVIWMVAGGFALGYGLNASGAGCQCCQEHPPR